MTLYEALFDFQDLYLTRLADSSRRISDPIATDWQKICNEYDLYFQAVGQGDYATGTTHLDNIVTILNGYSLIVDEPIQAPLPLSIYASPSVIDVPVDFLGLNPNYTNSYSRVYVYMGGIDDSANWSYAISGNTNTTANISDHNRINVTALTADYGTVTIEVSKTNYSTLTFTLIVNRRYDPEPGLVINEYPDTIVIPCDPVGVPLSYAQAYSDIIIREGTSDETVNWGLAITGTTDVTANISGGNRVNITNIAALEGSVEVTCTRSSYPTQVINVYVQKQLQGQAVVDGSSVDNVTIELNVSDQLRLKDDGITTEKLNTTDIFSANGEMVEYLVTDTPDNILKSTTLRRPPDLTHDKSLESSHAVGYGENNFIAGNSAIIGPSNSDNEYVVKLYNPLLSTITIGTFEGDVTADFIATDKILVWNHSTDRTDNTRYYFIGTIVSSSWDGTNTTVEFTPDFTIDQEVEYYIINLSVPTNDIVVSSFTPAGYPSHGIDNTAIGYDIKVNGSRNIIYGRDWYVDQGPHITGITGNVLIGGGNGNDEDVLGNGHLFIVPAWGNQLTLTFHENSAINTLIGNYVSFGQLGDSVGRSGNVSIGSFHQILCNSSFAIGYSCKTNTDGEIVFGIGEIGKRKVHAGLTATTTTTGSTTLRTMTNGDGLGGYFATPSSYKIIEDSMLSFTVNLIGVQSSGNVYQRRAIGSIKNIAGTTSLIGSVTELTDYSINEFAITSYSITANDTTDTLDVTVTPSSSTSTQWLGWLEGEIVEF